MSLFCFLVVPLFIVFRHSLRHNSFGGRKGIALAVVLGLAAALLRQAVGDLIPAGLFGFLRWFHLFMDHSALPALLPLGALLLLKRFRGSTSFAEPTDFALIWLVPVAAFRAIAWSATGDPSNLVLAPLLWLSIAVGVPLFVDVAEGEIGFRSFGAGALAVLLPLAGTTSSWAFFVHRPLIGFLAFAATATPMVWSMTRAFMDALPRFEAPRAPVDAVSQSDQTNGGS